jgi:hypothetical protein
MYHRRVFKAGAKSKHGMLLKIISKILEKDRCGNGYSSHD